MRVGLGAVAVISLVLGGIPSAFAAAASPLPPPHHTQVTIGTPPVVRRAFAVPAPRTVASAPGTPVNVDVAGLPGAQSETTIVTNPANPHNLVAGSNDLSGLAMRAYASLDGGATWRSGALPLVDNLGDVGLKGTSDPSIAADLQGNFYYGYLLETGITTSNVVVARSSDGGQTWGSTATAVTPGNVSDDKEMLGADDWPGSQGALYVAWDRTDTGPGNPQTVYISSSANGGTTWSAPVAVSPASETRVLYAQPAVAPDHSVYVVWDDYGTAGLSHIMVSHCFAGRSSTCMPPTVAGVSKVNLDGPGPYHGTDACAGGLGSDCYAIAAQPHRGIAAGPTIAVDGSGAVSLTWTDAPAPDTTDIVFARSTDGGQTWSTTTLNDDASAATNYDFLPWLTVDPRTGMLVATFYSTRNDSAHEKTDVYLTDSTDSGLHWSPNQRVTGVSSDEGSGTGADINDYGDYEGVTAWDGRVHPVWTDTRLRSTVAEEVYTSAVNLPPAAPTGLTMTDGAGGSRQFSWNTVAGATYYNLYGGSSVTTVTDAVYAGITASTYTLLAPPAGLNVFGVTAVDDGGESALSTVVPPAPTPSPSGGGGGGTGGGSGGVSTAATGPTVPGLVDTTAIAAAIAQAAPGAAAVVPLAATQSGGSITLTSSAAAALASSGHALEVTLGSMTATFPPADLSVQPLQQANPVFNGLDLSGAQVGIALATAAGSGSPDGYVTASPEYTFTVTVTTGAGAVIRVGALPQPVQVDLPYNAGAISDPRRLALYRLDGPGVAPARVPLSWAVGGGVVAVLPHFSTYAALEIDVAFADIQGQWAEGDIEAAAAHGLVQGVGGGVFAPEAEVTRAEFAAMLVRALAIPASSGTAPFSDVAPDAWYAADVAAASAVGIVTGLDAAHFAPDAPIDREQMAAMLGRALAYVAGQRVLPTFAGGAAAFRDLAGVDAWAQQAVAYTAQLGLLRGNPDGTLQPLDTATRAQAAVVLVRLGALVAGSPLRP